MQPDGKGRSRQAACRTGIVFNEMGSSSPKQRPWWPASALSMAPVGRGYSSAAVPGLPKATYSPLAYAKRQRAASSAPEVAEEGADDDGLSDLLSLALSKSSSSDEVANNVNMDIPLAIGKSETSESATFTNLPNNLHGGDHVGLQPQAQPLECTNLLASTGFGMGVARFGIRLPGDIVMPQPFIIAGDTERDDNPLISKRAAGCRTLDNLDVGWPKPVATSLLFSGSILQQQQQQSGSPELGGVSGVASVANAAAGSGGGGVASTLAGVRSGSPLHCSRPHPAWPAEAGCLLYVAAFLTRESRDVLLAMVPPLHALVTADHMALTHQPVSVQQLLSFPLGAFVKLNIIGAAADSRTQAAAADVPPWLLHTAPVSAHVTISAAPGVKAEGAGDLIRDALQLAAAADPAGPVVSGAGTLQRFGEPLQLVGRLGLKVALPSGQAVVMYSVDELAAGGLVSLCSDDISTFYAMHGERVAKPLQRQHSPTSCLDLPSTTVSASSSGGGATVGGPYSPFTAAAADDMPPLQLPPALISSQLGAVHPNSYLGPTLAAADAGVVAQQQLSMPPAGPCAGESAEQLLSSSAGDDETSSSSGSDSDTDAVQFRSAVQVGDYVALRPFVPTAGGEVLLQGYVREFACEEAFQGNGVMVVLTDNTIGFVVAVLDPAGSGSSGASGSSSSSSKCAAVQPKASKPNQRKQKAARKKAAAQRGKLAALDAAASETADVLSEWAMSQHDAAMGGVAATTAAAGLGVRNAADAARDMHLWTEFDALQHQHGEELCSAILRSCDHNFEEAIATIKAQAAGFGSSTGSAATSDSAAAAAAAAAAPAAGAAAAVQQPAAAAAATPDDELVVQLALSLGLPAVSALALCRLVPHVAPEAAVEALQQHSGDANQAADALLAAAASAAAVAAAGHDGEPAGYGAVSGRFSPAERVAASFVRARDPELVVRARSLCAMFAGLQQELAELVLQEHGGSLERAARAITDMQAKELQARTAAAAADTTGSPSRLHSGPSKQQQGQQQQQLSEEDQMAMLAAMGLLDPTEQQQQQQQQQQFDNRSSSPIPRQQCSPPKTPQPCSPLLAPAQHQQLYSIQPTSRPSSSNAANGYSPLSTSSRQAAPPPQQQNQQQQGVYGSPGRYSSRQQHPMVGSHGNQEAKASAKAAADKLYAKSRTLSQGSIVLMTAAQAMLAEQDEAGYREKKAAAERLRAESRAAFDEAQRLSWSANNTTQQTWQVDLHGLGTSVALRKFVGQFSGLEAMASGHPGGVLYQVITGKGNHSEDNVPKIKLGVMQYLQERGEAVLEETGRPWRVSWQVDPCNEGVLNVYIPGCSEEEEEGMGSSA